MNKYLGITAPIEVNGDTDEEAKLSASLKQYLESEDIFETSEGLLNRMLVLSEINKIVQNWIKEVTLSKFIGEEIAMQMKGKMYSFGSFRLGVHMKGSDIDLLIVAPRHIHRQDFFTSFAVELKKWDKVEYVRTIEEAFVPLLKTKINEIEVDIIFARLALKNIPENQTLDDSEHLRNLDKKCVRSLNGCRVTEDILKLVPNQEVFRLALIAIKQWAKKRGIYGNAFGYLGGVSWALLVARICQLYPNKTSGTIVMKFFKVYNQWEWPCPVYLRRNEEDWKNLGFPVWDSKTNDKDKSHLMPIITPSYPQQNSTFNVTKSTRFVMVEEIAHGLEACNQIASKKESWKILFQEADFFSLYNHFLVIKVESNHDYIGFVQSKVRLLIQNLEHQPAVKLAHIYTKEFHDFIKTVPAVMWFIGLKFDRQKSKNIDLTADIKYFDDTVRQAHKGIKVSFEYRKRAELFKLFPQLKKKSKECKESAGKETNGDTKKRKSGDDEKIKRKKPKTGSLGESGADESIKETVDVDQPEETVDIVEPTEINEATIET